MNAAWETIIRIIAAFFLVMINGFFVAAEFALVKVRDTQLQPLALSGNRRARLTRTILGKLDPYLGACQLGITMASLLLTKVGEPAFVAIVSPILDRFGVVSESFKEGVGFFVGYSLITAAHIVVGEQAPKFLALKRPVVISLWCAFPLHLFYRCMSPFIAALNIASNRVLSWIGIESSGGHGDIHTEEELRLLVVESAGQSGGTTPQETRGRDIVLNAFDLRKRNVRDVMRPRNEIVWFNTGSSLLECLDLAERTRYSRFPLCDGANLDKTIGVVHFKDLMAQRHRGKTGTDLIAIMRPLIYVPETARLEKVLGLFLERKLHMALVVDDYGGTVGLITLENCIEELVGQIQDEHDQEKLKIVRRSDREWEVDGTLPLFELAELMGVTLEGEGVATAGGWVGQRLGGFVKAGDRCHVGGFEVIVDSVSGVRVMQLVVRRNVIPAANNSGADIENVQERLRTGGGDRP